MSFLSNLIKKTAPIVAAVSPEPFSKAAATAITIKQNQQQQSYLRKQAEIRNRAQEAELAEIFGSGSNLSSVQAPMAGGSTSSSGFGSSFASFAGDFGRNILNPLGNLFGAVSPFFGGSTRQQPAVTTTRGGGAQETQQSGSLQGMPQTASVGNLLAPITKFLKNPVGALGTGIVGGLLGESFVTPSTGMRITRKMKSQARMVVNMTGGDLGRAADILGIDQNTLVFILLKRFRNDGPVVTKAALRKTKQTVRSLKSMCDMYDSLRPTATRRRTPMKRASSTTLIKN